MLIGGDDISNDVITLCTRLSMFVYIGACFRFADWQKSDSSVDGKPQRTGGGIQIRETYLQALLSFPAPLLERPRELALWLDYHDQDYHDFT